MSIQMLAMYGQRIFFTSVWIELSLVLLAAPAATPEKMPAGLKGDDGIYNYYAQVFQALGPDIPVVCQDYPQATGVYLPPPVFERQRQYATMVQI